MPQFFKSIGIASQALSVMDDPQDVIDPPGTPSLNISSGEIIFENVSFQYRERKLFDNKNVHIKGGRKNWPCGIFWGGKSTFVNLILRFYPLDKGRILIDGKDIAFITLDSLHKQMTLIPQDPHSLPPHVGREYPVWKYLRRLRKRSSRPLKGLIVMNLLNNALTDMPR